MHIKLCHATETRNGYSTVRGSEQRPCHLPNVTPCSSLTSSPDQAVSLQEAKLLLKEDDELIKEVFDYWTRKRKNGKHSTLHPTVKQEKRDGSSTSDPYVAFRRRTEKMQTRKVGSHL